MTTPERWRVALVSVLPALAVSVACAQLAPPATVRVALGLERARTENPGAYLVPGRTLGVVCFGASPPTTVAAIDMGAQVDAFRAALATGDLPVQTQARAVALPVPVAYDGEVCDLTLFDDTDADGRVGTGRVLLHRLERGPRELSPRRLLGSGV